MHGSSAARGFPQPPQLMSKVCSIGETSETINLGVTIIKIRHLFNSPANFMGNRLVHLITSHLLKGEGLYMCIDD